MRYSIGSSTPRYRPEDYRPGKIRAGVRIGDTERDVIIGRLNKALADGELTVDENLHRVAQVLAARYLAELGVLIEDLPVPPPGDLERFRAWLGRQDENVNLWLAGIPAGMIIGIVPVCALTAYPSGIGPFRAAIIAATAILGLWVVIMAVVLAVAASDKRTERRNHHG
jgi:hypothetical protein